MSARELEIFTVYFNPSDIPGKYVVRRAVITGDGAPVMDADPVIVCDDLSAARRPLQAQGRVCFGREDADDPVIVEVWL